MAGQLTKLRIESLEDRRVLSVAPLLDLNGVAPGTDFTVERVDRNGLVAIVSHDMFVSDGDATQLLSATVTIANHKAGDTLGALTHGTNINAAYVDGVLQLTGIDSVANYQQVLRTARFNSTATRTVGDQVDISFVVNDGLGISEAAHSIVTVIPAGTATVAGRHLFYNHSKFDGDNLAADAADDLAIATDKQALRQGQLATLANYTSYDRGINGIIVDITGPHGAVSANDFIFQVGNNNFPDTWRNAPEPVSIVTRVGAGQGSSDRVEIIWADEAIANEWLQVVVAANSHTGLATPNTFLVGNSTAESGNSANDARVTAKDALRVINRLLHSGISDAAINDPLDYNRDGRIMPSDVSVAIKRILSSLPELNLINVVPIAPERLNSTSSTGIIISWDTTTSPPMEFVLYYPPPLIDGHPLVYGEQVSVEPTSVTLRFPYALNTDGGAAGVHSAGNPANYRLLKDGVEQLGSIVSVAINAITTNATQSLITISFDRALTQGDYQLVALGTIHDADSQPIRGPGSVRGSDYSTSFSVSSVVRHGDASIVARSNDAPVGGVLTPAVASTPSGDFVVAFSKQSYLYDKFHLFIQRFSPSHSPLGAPQLVSTDINIRDVSLGIDAAGTLTVVWSSQPSHEGYGGIPSLENPGHIFARRFGADLRPLGDEFRVDPAQGPGDWASRLNPDLAVNAQGDIVVSWMEAYADQIFAQLYDAAGQARGAMFPLSSKSNRRFSSAPRIAMDATGNFAAVWRDYDFTSNRLVARLFDASGQPRGAEFNIQESTNGTSWDHPAIAMSPSGDFIVAWTNDGWDSEVLVRRFDSLGQPVGEAFRVDEALLYHWNWSVGSPQLSLGLNGEFLVGWQSSRNAAPAINYYPPISAKSLFFARMYDAAGHALSPTSLATSDQLIGPRSFGDDYVGPYVGSAAMTTNGHGQAMMIWTESATQSFYQSSLLVQTWTLGHPPEAGLDGPA